MSKRSCCRFSVHSGSMSGYVSQQTCVCVRVSTQFVCMAQRWSILSVQALALVSGQALLGDWADGGLTHVLSCTNLLLLLLLLVHHNTRMKASPLISSLFCLFLPLSDFFFIAITLFFNRLASPVFTVALAHKL